MPTFSITNHYTLVFHLANYLDDFLLVGQKKVDKIIRFQEKCVSLPLVCTYPALDGPEKAAGV